MILSLGERNRQRRREADRQHDSDELIAMLMAAPKTRDGMFAAIREHQQKWSAREEARMSEWWSTPPGWRRRLKYWLGRA